MFTLITPALRPRYKDLLSRIMATREGYYDLTMTEMMTHHDTPETVYVAYENKELGVFASARINPLTDSPASFFYRNTYGREALAQKREVSLISFNMEEDHWAQNEAEAFDNAICSFYEGLYEALVVHAIGQGIKGYVTLMDEEEHEDLTFFGAWPVTHTHAISFEKAPLAVGEVPVISPALRSVYAGTA